jgi:hypothetical protein
VFPGGDHCPFRIVIIILRFLCSLFHAMAVICAINVVRERNAPPFIYAFVLFVAH